MMMEAGDNQLAWYIHRVLHKLENVSKTCFVCGDRLPEAKLQMAPCEKPSCLFSFE